jgi:ankyrin repeat protein
MVALLLERGAAATRKDAAGLTPLHYLARGPHPYPLQPSWSRSVRLLARHGGRLDALDDAGRTPLSHAAGDVALARLLIANGGLTATAGTRGASPLHVAVLRGNELLVGSLIAAGAALDARDGDGRTPLHWAAFMGRERPLAALVAGPGIDLEAVDKEGHTALWWAVEACQAKAADLLRAKGARPPPAEATRRNAMCTGSGEPPLHAAARTMNIHEARKLIAAGADVKARDGKGRTALHVARTSAIGVPFDLYRLLIDKGADVSARDGMGRTPLHAAYDMEEGGAAAHFAELLGCRGGDPNPRDLFGWTPIDLALLRGWRAPAVPACSPGGQRGTPPPP